MCNQTLKIASLLLIIDRAKVEYFGNISHFLLVYFETQNSVCV